MPLPRDSGATAILAGDVTFNVGDTEVVAARRPVGEADVDELEGDRDLAGREHSCGVEQRLESCPILRPKQA